MQETTEPVIVAEQPVNNEALEKLQKQIADKEEYIQKQASEMNALKSAQSDMSKPEQYKINEDVAQFGDDFVSNVKARASDLNLNQDQFNLYLLSEARQKKSADEKVKATRQEKMMEFGKDKLDAIEVFAKEKRGLSDNSIARMTVDELKAINSQRDGNVYSITNQVTIPSQPEKVDTMSLLNRIEDPTSTLQERIKAQEEYANAFRVKR